MGLEKLNNLYRDLLLDYANHPKHAQLLPDASRELTLHNTTCGDSLHLTAVIKDQTIAQIGYQATGFSLHHERGGLGQEDQ